MGKVSTKPQVGQDGQETGNLLLEIVYGGHESPFGGMDTSAPPAYIDPRCATVMDHLLVVDNKLCAVSWQPLATPTLWSGTSGVKLIKFGTFYNSINGQLNYALGYIPSRYGVTATNYTFYITAWKPDDITQFWNDTIAVSFVDAQIPAEFASLTLPLLTGNPNNTSAGAGATANITAVGGGGTLTTLGTSVTGGAGYVVGESLFVTQGGAGGLIRITGTDLTGAITSIVVVLTFTPGFVIGAAVVSTPSTPNTVLSFNSLPGAPAVSVPDAGSVSATITAMVAAINADGAVNPYLNAAPSTDGLSLVLTAINPGTIGNTIVVQDISDAFNEVGIPFGYYFPNHIAQNFTGGRDASIISLSQSISNVTNTVVGGTVYFSNFGPLILKYSGPGLFQISSMYNGMTVLRKFAGSLIGLGVIQQLGVVLQDTDMIFAWSAALNLDEWSPVDSNGYVTGAGFNQLGDIEDYLTGLIVTNNTAYILRAKGVSYATALSSGTDPFSFAHISLGHEGEGAQLVQLICQYDQEGVFVSTSDVYQVAGQISSIGQKIKTALFSQLNNLGSFTQLSATAGTVFVGGDEVVVVLFQLGDTFFIFNTENGTWSTLEIAPSYPGLLVSRFEIQTSLLDTFASLNVLSPNDNYDQNLVTLGLQYENTVANELQVPVFYTLQEKTLSAVDQLNNQVPVITFPQEELLFGRDVTIDALYVSLWGKLDTDVTLEFDFNGTLFSSQVLPVGDYTTVDGNPTEIKFFPTNTNGTGVFTAHSPQLSAFISPKVLIGTPGQVRIAKIQMFGSFDPNQRPV